MATTITLCLRHLPCKVLEDDFKDIMTEYGFAPSRFELFFPKKKGRQGRLNNFGYGFLTCWQEEDARAFARVFQHYRFEHIDSDKELFIEQGNSSMVGEQMRGTTAWRRHSEGYSFAGASDERGANNAVLFKHTHSIGDFVKYGQNLCDSRRMAAPNEDDVPPTHLCNSAHVLHSEAAVSSTRHQLHPNKRVSGHVQDQMIIYQ
eukprot:TRINITY_DN58258_c0_g1_i1.p1 TRINITY_DN58258_c0_g1~~TRINITY_DN58258_c0_g1_i1.p1  ORF type:complete len:229 (+),score=30.18 TRINITY_DN58258_c0_g1_i1:78-689(+)